MPDFSSTYETLADRRDLQRSAREVETTRRKLRRARRELREIEGDIPFWDRLLFFDESPDEARADELRSRIEELEPTLEEARERFDSIWSQIEAEFFPLELGRRLDDACELAAEMLRVEGAIFEDLSGTGELRSTLREFADTVVDTYVPDFDPEVAFEPLESREQCESLSPEEPLDFETDEQLGYRPIDLRRLQRAMARKLLNSSYFEARSQMPKAAERVDKLEKMLADAEQDVSVIDELNVFSESAEQVEREQIEQKLREARRSRTDAAETLRHNLLESVGAFPPMALYSELQGALGAIDALEPGTTTHLESDGTIGSRKIVEPKTLLLVALQKVREAFRRAFPGVETPSELRERVVEASEQGLEPPVRELEQSFYRELERHRGDAERRDALVHATMVASLRRRRTEVSDRIDLLDRAVFWSDTEAEATEEELERRESWNARQIEREWSDLLDAAHRAGAAQPELRLRDTAVEALGHLHDVHTDSGTRSTPRDCDVYGRQPVYDALGEIREILKDEYGLRGDRQTLMEDVVERMKATTKKGAPSPSTPEDGGPFEPLEYDAVVEAVAARLPSPDQFMEVFEKVTDLSSRKRELETELQRADSSVSFWDEINVFSETPAEQRRSEVRNLIATVDDKLGIDAREMNAQFEEALRAYPPARLYYMLDGVVGAVRAIRAVCRSRTVTRGTGDDRETDTEYYCDLEGLDDAIWKLRSWNARFVDVFGDLPEYRDLLVRWVEEDVPDPATGGELSRPSADATW